MKKTLARALKCVADALYPDVYAEKQHTMSACCRSAVFLRCDATRPAYVCVMCRLPCEVHYEYSVW